MDHEFMVGYDPDQPDLSAADVDLHEGMEMITPSYMFLSGDTLQLTPEQRDILDRQIAARTALMPNS